MSYLEQLSSQLERVGVDGRRRTRILAEIADHLDCDPTAKLGDPELVARQFADELGTFRARRAAAASFAALALAGAVVAAVLLLAPTGALRNTAGSLWGRTGGAIAAIGAQVAFVAGTLAALRALRRRNAIVMPRAEAALISRRTVVGLASGAATMVGIALVALGQRHQVPSWWTALALAGAGVGTLAVLAATPATIRAGRLKPIAPGPAGDLFDDLGEFVPPALRGRSWTFAIAVAVALATVIAAAGVLQSDGYDGALRGILDGGACLAGFMLGGRYLGLRS